MTVLTAFTMLLLTKLLTAFAVLLIVIKFTLSDAPHTLDNLSKLLFAIAAPSASTLTKNVHKFLRVPVLGAALGGERSEQL